MKSRIAIAAAAVLAVTGISYAAAPAAPAAPPAAATTTTFTLVAADATKLKTWIADQKKASVAAPAGFTVAVGAVVPAAVTVNDITAAAGVPTAVTYKFATIGDKVVLVNATDRKIVYIFS
jgi:Protein of unknown function (DUF1236)